MADVPLAYFLTFRAYGTWLPGDARGSVRRRSNAFDSPPALPNAALESHARSSLEEEPVRFDAPKRRAIDAAIREVCEVRGWNLLALNVRTNHVHLIVECSALPERAMNDFKIYATRRMVAARILPTGTRPWARHGSTRPLWTDKDVEDAWTYVIHGQGPDL